MAPCSRCGSEMSWMAQYNQWYCSYCQQYQQPAPAQPPSPAFAPQYSPQQPQYLQQQPPPAPKKSSKMLMIGILVVIIIVVIGAAAAYLLLTPEEEKGKTVTMTHTEFEEDFDNEAYQFKSIDEGDTLKIVDEIAYIASEYDDYKDTDVTYIWFESSHEGESYYDFYDPYWGGYQDYDFTFEGDLTSTYSIGDTVVVTLHCTEFEDNGTTIEVFEEMDSSGLPDSCIKLKSGGGNGGTIVTKFPTIEVTLHDGQAGIGDERLVVKHVQGDPLDWSNFKLIITNQSDETDMASLNDLSSLGEISAGETSVIDSDITGFSSINYQRAKSYQIEIYNIKENKRVYERSNVICE